MLHSLFHLPSVFIFIFFVPLICRYNAEDDHLSSQNNNINNTFPAIFAFGDSIFDTGNNNLLDTLVRCNFPPYGRDFIGGKPTGRFSNGKVALDFLGNKSSYKGDCDLYIYMYNFVFVFHLLVELLGIKEALPPFLDPTLQVEDLATGTSFASGGSGFDPLTPKAMVYVDALYYYIDAVFFCIT